MIATNPKMIKKSKRAKRPTGVLQTREEVERSLSEYARLMIERDSLGAEMDERIRQVRAEYEDRLSELTTDAEIEFEMIADWAARNPNEFADRKSLSMTHGTIGFRTGMPRLKTRRGTTWNHVLMLLTTLKRFNYIRSRQEPDKEKLLADREKLGKDGLAEVGVEVEQTESFFCEIRREPVEDMA